MNRVRQIVVGLLGLAYVGLLYPLYTDLWHSKWLIAMHNEECEPMFLSFFIALGVFLLLAAREPMRYRLVIAFAAWQSFAHAATMLIQTIEASRNGTPRNSMDVFVAGAIGIVMLLMIPPKKEAAAMV